MVQVNYSERLDSQKAFNKQRTYERFGYYYPKKAKDKISLNCVSCGQEGQLSINDFSTRIKTSDYFCKGCASLRREDANYSIDWKSRCDDLPGYDVIKTELELGYAYPQRGSDLVYVLCSLCNESFKQEVSEAWKRQEIYRCKLCAAKLGFTSRRESLFHARDAFWEKTENRQWMSDLAKSQGERRSENLTLLNKDVDFQQSRIEGLNASPNLYSSKGEVEIREFITSLGLEVKKKIFGMSQEQRLALRGGENLKTKTFEIDAYIPKLNIGIEHNGVFYHSTVKKPRQFHYNKWYFFKTFHEIQLIQIWEHEWLFRKEQVKSRLRSLLQKNQELIYARKCKVLEVDCTTAINFVNRIHIQPCHNNLFLYALGLYYEERLVSCAIFSRHHRNKDEVVLQRFVTEDNTTVLGGLSRLSEHAYQHFGCSLYSWCDLRWSSGDGYEKAGWKKVSQLPPDYFYVGKKYAIISKQSRKKSLVHTPEGMTESQHAALDGLLTLYDCGKIKFKFK